MWRKCQGAEKFQSTPSARRATLWPRLPEFRQLHFNPRPPRGGRPGIGCRRVCPSGFQSTPSARRATPSLTVEGQPVVISIHALREEGDTINQLRQAFQVQFQSTPSARRATREGHGADGWVLFQSTPSARRATFFLDATSKSRQYFNPRPPRGGRPLFCSLWRSAAWISIHALREEGDILYTDRC